MIKVNKEVGETPLELIQRIRTEMPDLENERISYAGRLDPMAEGETILLIGYENNHREKYLGYDKEYVATFLVGFETDSGDILGLITDSSFERQSTSIIENNVNSFKKIKKQTYPWFSGKTVNGKKLFEYFKAGDLSVERPCLGVEIKNVEFLDLKNIPKGDTKDYILESIPKVRGDFRQEKILEAWRKNFESAPETFQVFDIKIRVSSGTFIRALVEEFEFPVCLLRLKRTKVFSE